MISTENFYWVLYQQLLRPVGLECLFYYPFGTTQNLALLKFNENHYPKFWPPLAGRALFHFDQEPIYATDMLDINRALHGNYYKFLRLLANSEISQIKSDVCREFCVKDWYYFYHGFAALDWYRDAQYVTGDFSIKKHFCSLNHIVSHKRAYRMALLARLMERDCVEKGTVSFHGTIQDCIDEVERTYTALAPVERDLVIKHLINGDCVPMIADHARVDGTFSARFGHPEYVLRQQCFLHIVNETVFYDPKQHLTEKIFQPIISERPFVLAGAPGNLRYLQSYGFKTFADYFDESYDDILDPVERTIAIADIVHAICKMSLKALNEMLNDMRPILQYNKQHFFNQFRHRIAGELVDNFDTCIRLWNNGRVDDRGVPSHPDLEAVKKFLAGQAVSVGI